MTTTHKAPVFVVGSARSGNTMLYHMLLSSGRFPVYRTEPCVFDLLVPRFGDFRSLSTRRELMRCWPRTKQFRRSGLDAGEITEKVLTSVTTGGEFLRAVMEEMARAGGFQRWAVGGPDNLLHIPTIKRQIPDALFIHVIRDGRDVACALDRKEFIRPFRWDRSYRLYVSALHWMWKVQTGRRHGRAIGSDYLEVRFEDLVLHPEEALTKVGAFIGENLDYEKIRKAKIGVIHVPNTSFTEEWKSGSFSPVGRWRRQLSDDKVTRLEGLVGELLVELGYPLSRAETTTLGFRLRTMRTMYPSFYQLKEWLKTATPLGRFVNINRLQIDQHGDSSDVEEGAVAGESAGLLSSTPATCASWKNSPNAS
ncbi:MAG: sulfotransferase [Terriglobales bacterium]